MNKELYQDYINGLSISELSNKYKVSKTRVYKVITECSKKQGDVLDIINNKDVQMVNLKASFKRENGLEYYNWLYKNYDYMQLTYEEFNKLKEWQDER